VIGRIEPDPDALPPDTREWPKWIHLPDGSVIANNAEEERCILDCARSHRMQLARDIGRARANAVQAARADAFAIEIAPVIVAIRADGIISYRGIADALNRRGIASPRDGRWQASQILRLFRRLGLAN
jgi:hypothetical protein